MDGVEASQVFAGPEGHSFLATLYHQYVRNRNNKGPRSANSKVLIFTAGAIMKETQGKIRGKSHGNPAARSMQCVEGPTVFTEQNVVVYGDVR